MTEEIPLHEAFIAAGSLVVAELVLAWGVCRLRFAGDDIVRGRRLGLWISKNTVRTFKAVHQEKRYLGIIVVERIVP